MSKRKAKERKFKKEPKIFMFMASWNGKIAIGQVNTFWHWFRNHDIHTNTTNHMVPLDYARNWAIYAFLKTDCTHFLGLDDDIVPGKDSLKQLLDLKKDCVAPLMFTTKPDPVRHNPLPVPVPIVYEKSNSKQRYRVKMGLNGAHLEEVDLLPGGMFLLSRRAIEKARKPLFKYKYDRNGYLIGGTDCVMSERLKEAGFKIYVHRGIVVEQWIDIGAKALNDTMLRYCPMNIEKRIEEISSKSGVIKDG